MSRFRIIPILLFLGACASGETAECPDAHLRDELGVCRVTCTVRDDCLITETCSAGRCVPTVGDQIRFDHFRVDPLSIEPGETVTIEFAVTGADEVRLMPDDTSLGTGSPLSGSVRREPKETTTYRLVAFKDGSESMSETRRVEIVSVEAAPEIVRFDARGRPGNSIVITKGDSLLLEYEVENADTVVIDGRSGDTLGSNAGRWFVAPDRDTTYELTATNDEGSTTRSLTVVVEAPPRIDGFVLSEDFVLVGSAAQIRASWRVSGSGMVDVQLVVDDGLAEDAPKDATDVALFSGPHGRHRSARLIATSPLGRDEAVVQLSVLQEATVATSENAPAALDDVAYLALVAGTEAREFWGSVRTNAQDAIFGIVIETEANTCDGPIRIEVFGPTGLSLADTSSPCPAPFGLLNAPAGVHTIRISGSSPGASLPVVVYAAAIERACGDATVQAELGEACDDGNNLSGDGCDSRCSIEPENVYTLNARPSGVTPIGPLEPLDFAPRAAGDDPRDDGVVVLPLTFSFPFFSNRYDAVTVDVDGFVGFLPPTTPEDSSLGGLGAPNGYIAAFGLDLELGPGNVSIARGSNRVQIWYENLAVENSADRATGVITLFESGVFHIDYIRTPRRPFTAGAESASSRGVQSLCLGPCGPGQSALLEGRRFEFLP